MKVLWFTNTPSLGIDHLNSKIITGGWIESLEDQINKVPDLELGIVFKWKKSPVSPFMIKKTIYYPIFKSQPKGKIKKLLNRWKHKIENEDNIQQYLSVIKEFNPDIIHIFGTESDFGLIIPKISTPCIIHIQGNLTVYGHKWFDGISLFDILKYSSKLMLAKGHGFLHDYLINRKGAEREKKIFLGCHFFMGRTDWDKRIAMCLSPKSKYFHCEEILRENFYLHHWVPDSSEDIVIITTIRDNIYKGLETIFECMKILKENYPKLKLKWKIAGINSQDEITGLIEKIYKDKFINNNIYLLGPLAVNELIDEMLNADLFIHPSHIDNSPNSVCEAMVLGMPIIATYAGGTPSLLQDKKEGLLLQSGDPFALVGAIMELINDKKYATYLGTNARLRAMNRHNRERITNEVLNIYNSIINL